MIRQAQFTLRFAVGVTAFFVLALSLTVSLTSDDDRQRWDVGVALFVVMIASLAVGVLLGFVFGLPRARVVDSTAAGVSDLSNADSTARRTRFLMNSNLIKVSDWITTIVIGLSLVNLRKIVPAMTKLARWLRTPLGGFDYSSTIGISCIIGGLILGFVLGYMWTSIGVRLVFEELEHP